MKKCLASTVNCTKDLLLHYPFDVDVEDHSCTGAKSLSVGKIVLMRKHRRLSAFFDGTCRIEVGGTCLCEII